jgi:hypothetical protein
MRPAPLALALALAAAAVSADPIPVHIAAPRGVNRAPAPSAAERLSVADAVADALRGERREVLSGAETRSRIEALNPSAVTCDALDCITAITLPLHARALVMVRETRQRDGTTRIEVRLVNLRGEVIAERAEQEIAPSTAEAVALARLAASSVVDAMQRFDTPAPTPEPAPAPAAAAPTPAPVEARAPAVVSRRRYGEVGAGVAALVFGAGAVAVGAVGLAGGERVVQDLGADRVLVERGSALNWVWLGAGAAALGVGVFLVVDGLRERPLAVSAAAIVPIPGGAAATIAGRF